MYHIKPSLVISFNHIFIIVGSAIDAQYKQKSGWSIENNLRNMV